MDKNSFQSFRRSQIAELRPYVPGEDLTHHTLAHPVSISEPDRENGSPKLGDMIARNPANHDDQWLVAADYFAANFEPLASGDGSEETSARVASIGGRYLGFNRAKFDAIVLGTSDADIEKFIDDVQALAGTATTQVADKEPLDFIGRLKLEREELDERLGKLAVYLGNGAPGASARQRSMLDEQSKLMSDLLAVLDERLADFIGRLKLEREELDERLGKLAVYLGNGAPGASARQRSMLDEQSKLMSDLLAVLDERLADLQIDARSKPADPLEQSDAE